MASQHLKDAAPSRTSRLFRRLSDLNRCDRDRPEFHDMLSDPHRRFRDRDRPELRSMRGPQWREKHAAASGQAPAPSS